MANTAKMSIVVGANVADFVGAVNQAMQGMQRMVRMMEQMQQTADAASASTGKVGAAASSAGARAAAASTSKVGAAASGAKAAAWKPLPLPPTSTGKVGAAAAAAGAKAAAAAGAAWKPLPLPPVGAKTPIPLPTPTARAAPPTVTGGGRTPYRLAQQAAAAASRPLPLPPPGSKTPIPPRAAVAAPPTVGGRTPYRLAQQAAPSLPPIPLQSPPQPMYRLAPQSLPTLTAAKTGKGVAGDALTGLVGDLKTLQSAAKSASTSVAALNRTLQTAAKAGGPGRAATAAGGSGGGAGAGLMGGLGARMGLANPYVAGAAAVGSVAVVGATFEKSIARVDALTRASGATRAEFDMLRKEALRLGATTEFTAAQSAEGMQAFALAGFKAREVFESIGPALRLATVGKVSIAEAADATATAIRAFRLEAADSAKVADLFAFGISNSMTSMRELQDAFKYVAPTARVAGLSIEETTSAIMLLSDQGIRGESAGTALRNILKKTSDQSDEARKMMNLLGLSFQDAQGNFKGMGTILKELNAATAHMGEAAKLEVIGTLFEIRAGTGMSALLDQGEKYEELVKRIHKEHKGVSKSMQDIELDTVWGRFKILQSSVEGGLIAVFDALKPAFDSVLGGVNDLVNLVIDAFRKFAPAINSVFGAVGSLFGSVSKIAGSLINLFGQLAPAIAPVIDALAKVVDALGTVLDTTVGLVSKSVEGWQAIGSAIGDAWESLTAGPSLFDSVFAEQFEQLKQMQAGIDVRAVAEAAGFDMTIPEGGSNIIGDMMARARAGLQAINPFAEGGMFGKGGAAETHAVNIQAQLAFADAVKAAQDNLQKQTGSLREAAGAAAELVRIQQAGGSILERSWYEAVQGTKEFAGTIEDLHKKLVAMHASGGATPDQIAGFQRQIVALQQLQHEARQLEQHKRLVEAAGKVNDDVRSPLREFATRVKDLDALQQHGFITARTYGDALRKAAEGAAGGANITELLTPWEQFETQVQRINRQFQNGLLDVTFYQRALFKAAGTLEQMQGKSGAGAAVFKGSAEAISAVDATFSRDNSGEKLAQQIMQQQLAVAQNQVGEQRQHRLENQRGFDELIRALGLKDRLPK